MIVFSTLERYPFADLIKTIYLYSNMTFFVGFWLSKSAVIRPFSNYSNISVKWNNMETNKLIPIDCQKFLLYSERKVMI